MVSEEKSGDILVSGEEDIIIHFSQMHHYVAVAYQLSFEWGGHGWTGSNEWNQSCFYAMHRFVDTEMQLPQFTS